MARKYDFISELYNRTCKTVVASPASWEAFLRSACYNYRLRFDEQLFFKLSCNAAGLYGLFHFENLSFKVHF